MVHSFIEFLLALLRKMRPTVPRRKQPPVGERRVCLVMTERFATVNWQQLSLWGVKGHDKIARHLVRGERIGGKGFINLGGEIKCYRGIRGWSRPHDSAPRRVGLFFTS